MRTSEVVALGHPDKVADYISEYILDRFLEVDSKTRYAVEVQIKNSFVSLAGEATSLVKFSDEKIAEFVRQAVNEIGYDKKYQEFWGKENVVCGDDLEVVSNIFRQSPDISCGVDTGGWGDQGIFFGYAENSPEFNYMPKDHALAREIAKNIYDSRVAGLDIKTQVTLDEGNRMLHLVVATPCRDDAQKQKVLKIIKEFTDKHDKSEDFEVVFNGTGEYIIHSTIGDSGTTGRKLVVDFYGGNSPIGGGSPWTKDGTKADLTLNLFARHVAKANLIAGDFEEVYTSISCCIGKPDILLSIKAIAKNGEIFDKNFKTKISHFDLSKLYELDKPNFANIYRNGLFYDASKKWEDVSLLNKEFVL